MRREEKKEEKAGEEINKERERVYGGIDED